MFAVEKYTPPSQFYYEDLLEINPTEVRISARNVSIPSVLPIQ